MKTKLSLTLVADCVLMLALVLSARPAVEAGRRLDQAPPSQQVGAMLGDNLWTPLGGPIVSGGEVRAIAVDPSAPGTVYAAVSPAPGGGSTIYRSTDGSASWTPLYETESAASGLAAHGSLILATAGVGDYWHTLRALYASPDLGGTWFTPRGLTEPGLGLGSVSISPANPQVAIAAGNAVVSSTSEFVGVVYGTANGGLDWSLLLDTQGGEADHCGPALVSPHDSDRMLAGCGTEVYLSTDGGAIWDGVSTLGGSVNYLIAHPANAQTFFAGTWRADGIYRSQDGGLTWDQVLPDTGGPLAFAPPGTVYTASGRLVWASTQEGDPGTWSQVGELPGNAASLSIDTGVSPAALYAGLESGGVVHSTDGGVTWQERNSGLTSVPAVADVDVDPADPDRLFAATGDYGTEGRYGGWRSEDAGLTWTKVSDAEILTFDIRPDDPQIVLAGAAACDSATILQSVDGGVAFTGVYTPAWFLPGCTGGSEEIVGMAAAPSQPDTLYAVGTAYPAGSAQAGVVLRSQDGGLSWSQVLWLEEGGLSSVAVDPLDPDTAFVGGMDPGAVIYRTEDQGATWQKVLDPGGGGLDRQSLTIDPGDPNRVYASLHWNNFYRSVDGGDSWELLGCSTCYWSPGWNSTAVDPLDAEHVYLTGPDYVAESFDGGQSWSEMSAPLSQALPVAWSPNVLVPGRGDPAQTLYAGLSGVWIHSRVRPAWGDRYAAPGGSDAQNHCAHPDSPCQTVGYALGQANPGETVRVAGGSYVENVTIERSVTLEGGYSGPPDWTRDLGAYETVLDGSANPSIPGVWDGTLIGLPNVLWDGDAGLYRMYYTGAGGLSNLAIGLATSPDGVTWTRYPGNPVLVADSQPWEGDVVEEPFVRAEGGSYKMWYDNWTSIGYATSPDGVTWTKHPTPVLEPNPNPLAWDSKMVRAPSVVKVSGQYVMAYTGTGDPGLRQIGLATSSDGITWTRHGDPVLGPGEPGQWDEGGAHRADMAYAGGVYHLLYTSPPGWYMGVATSPDGVNWTRYAGNPVLPGEDPWEWQGSWGAGHLSIGGTWKAWYAAHGDTPTSIGLATSADGFVWTRDSEHNPVLEPGTPGDVEGAPVVRVYSPGEAAGAGSNGFREPVEATPPAQPRPEQVDVVLDGLTLTGGTYWYGGAVSVESDSVTLRSVRIAGNQAFHDGGGIWVNGGSTVEIMTSDIVDNSALGLGGGLYNAGTADLSRSTFSGNQAVYGGGIRNDGGMIDVLNCTFTGNAATVRGGAVDNDVDGSLDLLNSTLSGNSAEVGGGVAVASGTARAWNAILADNGGGECDGVWADGSNNLATDATCGSLFDQVSLDTLRLGNLTGSPAYYPLLFGSTAIDAGTTYFCPYVDEPGNVRPQDGDGDGVAVCDAGAYEAPTGTLLRVFLPLIVRDGP